MTEDDIAYTAAINVLRDTIESRRLPSSLPLEAGAAALHEPAVRHPSTDPGAKVTESFLPPAGFSPPGRLARLADPAGIPEGDIWLASQKSACTLDALAINPQVASHIRAYLAMAGHGSVAGGRCLASCAATPGRTTPAGRMDRRDRPRARKCAACITLARGYLAHPMRATSITTALENGAQLGDVRKAAGHRDPSTTKLYHRRRYNLGKAPSFHTTY
jgi:hypothetical protein